MRYAFDDARRGGAARDAVLRDVLQPRHLRQGLDRGHAALDAVDRRRLPPFADDTWELYDTNTDWSQAHDLAAEMPEKLDELKALFMEEARKYNVLPLDDRRVERFNSDLAGRPTLIKGNSQLLFGGMGRLTENVVINIKNKSHSVTAELTVPDGGAEGVIVAQGGAFAGWSLYVKDGRPKYCYNLFGLQRFHVESDTAIPPGTHQVRMEFDLRRRRPRQGRRGLALRRRHEDRRGPRRGHRPDGLLGRRDVRRRLRHRLAGQRRLHARRAAASPAPSSGCRSTSPTPPRTSTT